MKIFDCFMYYNEDFILDLRLNYLNKFIDFFVIVESLYNHKGEKKNLNFNIKNYQKFKEKIIYIVLDHLPDSIEIINDNIWFCITNWSDINLINVVNSNGKEIARYTTNIGIMPGDLAYWKKSE